MSHITTDDSSLIIRKLRGDFCVVFYFLYPSSESSGDIVWLLLPALLLMKFRISLKYESSLSSRMALLLSNSDCGDDMAVPAATQPQQHNVLSLTHNRAGTTPTHSFPGRLLTNQPD